MQWEYKWVPVTREWSLSDSGQVSYGTWEMAGTEKTGPRRIEALNEWGREGWELICAIPGSTVETQGTEPKAHEINSIGYTFVFKRPVADEQAPEETSAEQG